MRTHEELRKIVEDLVDVMHTQAKELEKLVAHIEQVAGHVGYRHEFSVVASELSELHLRVKKLAPEVAALGSETGEV